MPDQQRIRQALQRHRLVERQHGEAGERGLDREFREGHALGAGTLGLGHWHQRETLARDRIVDEVELPGLADRRFQRFAAIAVKGALERD